MALPKTELVDTARRVMWSWLQRFERWDQAAESTRAIGAERPTRPYVGQRFIDTTLGPSGSEIGRPIWAVKVEADGTVTWIDADGVVV